MLGLVEELLEVHGVLLGGRPQLVQLLLDPHKNIFERLRLARLRVAQALQIDKVVLRLAALLLEFGCLGQKSGQMLFKFEIISRF